MRIVALGQPEDRSARCAGPSGRLSPRRAPPLRGRRRRGRRAGGAEGTGRQRRAAPREHRARLSNLRCRSRRRTISAIDAARPRRRAQARRTSWHRRGRGWQLAESPAWVVSGSAPSSVIDTDVVPSTDLALSGARGCAPQPPSRTGVDAGDASPSARPPARWAVEERPAAPSPLYARRRTRHGTAREAGPRPVVGSSSATDSDAAGDVWHERLDDVDCSRRRLHRARARSRRRRSSRVLAAPHELEQLVHVARRLPSAPRPVEADWSSSFRTVCRGQPRLRERAPDQAATCPGVRRVHPHPRTVGQRRALGRR